MTLIDRSAAIGGRAVVMAVESIEEAIVETSMFININVFLRYADFVQGNDLPVFILFSGRNADIAVNSHFDIVHILSLSI